MITRKALLISVAAHIILFLIAATGIDFFLPSQQKIPSSVAVEFVKAKKKVPAKKKKKTISRKKKAPQKQEKQKQIDKKPEVKKKKEEKKTKTQKKEKVEKKPPKKEQSKQEPQKKKSNTLEDMLKDIKSESYSKTTASASDSSLKQIKERMIIHDTIMNSWFVPANAMSTPGISVDIILTLSSDGSIASIRHATLRCGQASSDSCQAFLSSVYSAVRSASPIEGLDPERYHLWSQEWGITFKPEM